MSGNFTYRADDFSSKEALDKYQEFNLDEDIIEKLVSRDTVIIEGSRGSGKTMLMKVAQERMIQNFKKEKVLPVYISFKKSMLVPQKYFLNWMLSSILLEIQRQVIEVKNLIKVEENNFLANLFGIRINEDKDSNSSVMVKINEFINILENSWKNQATEIDEQLIQSMGSEYQNIGVINDINYFVTLLPKICEEFEIKRIVLLFDEACHNFLPSEQRVFFNLFRDLRIPCTTCKAAVYPGITSYGDVFQMRHDATLIKLNRTTSEVGYITFMRNLLKRQLDGNIYDKLVEHGDLLNLIIYASSGNPRILLKSIYKATSSFSRNISTAQVNQMIKEFYREEIWEEHRCLVDKYPSYNCFIEWGRDYIEERVLIDIKEKNDKNEAHKGNTFAVDVNRSESVNYALKILEYAGIITKVSNYSFRKSMGGRNRNFDKYELNLGILLSKELSPNVVGKDIITHIDTNPLKYYMSFTPLEVDMDEIMNINNEIFKVLNHLMEQSIDRLDLTEFLNSSMKKLNLNTVGDILRADKAELMKAKYIGDVKSDIIINAALNATLEYISG